MTDPTMLRACAYVRVSTKRQAEHETSLNEQETGIARGAAERGYEIVETYVEAGRSGMTDRRPALQRMIADACAQPKRYDAVFVYNFSRFFRDEYECEGYRRKLEKAGVKLISATQDVGEGPHARLIRSIFTSLDAASSEINAEQVKVVMSANAEAGFHNGSAPPLGYRTYVAERRGKKDKKKLEIDPAERPLVELIFRLYMEGDGTGEPLGIGSIVKWLREHGYTHRSQHFHTGLIYAILTRETYAGRHYYGCRNSRTNEARPREEWIEVKVPAILSEERFQAVQQRLKARNPHIAAPRSHTSPVLLSGIGRCGCNGCISTMMLMTGKGGKYRYYACSNRRKKGDLSCGGNNVPMDKVDDAVVSALEKRLFQPERLKALLGEMLDASDAADADRRKRLAVLRTEETEVNQSIRALFMMVESGVTTPDDPFLKERLATLKLRLSGIAEEAVSLERQIGAKGGRITPEKVERFAEAIRARLRDADDSQVRRRYVRAFVGEVVMTRERLIIRGPNRALELAAAGEMPADDRVRTFMSDWRTRRDSNPRPRR
ncbi:recombinase family protein [Sphingomonas sp.]|uniref:recombinase family protein n=2 Tax=Sphingomonas TaxID=13687 RepID=UPI0034276366